MSSSQAEGYDCPLCDRTLSTKNGRGKHLGQMHTEDERAEVYREEILRVSRMLGRAPKVAEFREYGDYSTNACESVFGSWNEALQTAGLELNKKQGYTREELLDEIHRIADVTGRTPREIDLSEHGEITKRPFSRVFGSWNAALEAAGYEPNHTNHIPEQDLLDELDRLADELGHPPMREEMDALGRFSSMPYERHFGTWTNTLKAGGYDPYRENPGEGDRWHIYMAGFTDELKQRVRRRDGQECVDCGMSSGSHKDRFTVDLHVHHLVDPKESSNPAVYNAKRNLETLCILCHRDRHYGSE